MKHGLLLYTAKDAEKNQWFIQRLMQLAPQYGLSLTFALWEEWCLTDGRGYDFCINRTRYSSVNAIEALGVRCFNNGQTVEVANDKWQTYQLCRRLDIPVMDTVLAEDGIPPLPCIVKSRDGHGGNEVYWAPLRRDVIALTRKQPHRFILQQPAGDPGVDVRLYLLGDRVQAAVKRTCAIDFRSNFSLGGQVERFTPTDAMLAMAKRLQAHLDTDYVGVDFLRHEGEWVLNEIEDAVGARMLYSLWDGDIADLFMRHVAERL